MRTKKERCLEPEVRAVIETSVKIKGEMSEWFLVKVEVVQGSVLSSLFFAILWMLQLMMLTKQCKNYLFADG